MKFLHTLVVVGLVMMVHENTFSLPRFAATTGAKCQSCHVNPAGGGMRLPFGAQFGREELPVPTWSEDFEMEDFSTELSSSVAIGADMRVLFFTREQPKTNEFWQMQGDIYVRFNLARKITLYLDKGLYSGFEVFGLLSILPANGHIKLGKFIPQYGTKLDDHTVYIRQQLGFTPDASTRPELTGAEVGISPGPLNIVGGFYNAGPEFDFPGAGKKKAYLGRIDGMINLGSESHLSLGANIFGRENSDDVQYTYIGGMGAISFKGLTVFGEVDATTRDSAGVKLKGLVGYGEADYTITQGVDLKAAYDFYDPDTDVKSGSYSRYSFGVEFFPIQGVEIRPMFRIVQEEDSAGEKTSNNELHVLFHFYI